MDEVNTVRRYSRTWIHSLAQNPPVGRSKVAARVDEVNASAVLRCSRGKTVGYKDATWGPA